MKNIKTILAVASFFAALSFSDAFGQIPIKNVSNLTFSEKLNPLNKSFRAWHNYEKATLYWSMAGINEVTNIILEKSIDGINFKTLETIGCTPCNSKIVITDGIITKGIAFYRLKLVLEDNTFAYSRTLIIYNERKADNVLRASTN